MEFINSYALVTYVKGELATFVSSLREAFQPGDEAHAHITILPPRPLHVSHHEALRYIANTTENFEAFDVRPGKVEAFASTRVIKLSIAHGHEKLRTLYEALNSGPFQAVDAYDYNPHITLAFKIEPRRLEQCLEISKKLWEDFGPLQSVRIEAMTLVQQDREENWHDLGEVRLPSRRLSSQ